jgi:hypothetical protein
LIQNAAVTKTVTYAKYTQINKLCICNVRLEVTGTGTAGFPVIVGLPLTSATSSSVNIGSVSIYDGSAATMYAGSVRLLTSTTLFFVGDWSGNQSFGNIPAIALNAGDQVTFNIGFEVA